MKKFSLSLVLGALVMFTAACGGDVTKGSTLSGEIAIDGSSTVFPILEAVSEEYNLIQPGVKAPVGVSGTGGGFKQFVQGDTDLSNASRPIKEKKLQLLQKMALNILNLN